MLTQWAEYLRDKGLDPENQLCTDDFAGHLAHNANLSIKAILALGAYAPAGRDAGQEGRGRRATATPPQRWPQKWPEMADDGDHYRLAFDKPGTWSQKYNLVWDRLLGLNLFPPEVARQGDGVTTWPSRTRYGLPLDNRKTYTKLDWIIWTATLAENEADFRAFIDPLYALG